MADVGSIYVADIVEGQNLTLNITVTSYSTVPWHWEIRRLTGDSPDGFNPSYGDYDPSLGSGTATVLIADDTVRERYSEMQWQGEGFDIELRTGPNPGPPNRSGTLIDKQNLFILYDNDSPITAFTALIDVSTTASSHTQYINFGNFTPYAPVPGTINYGMPYRIYRADTFQNVFTGTADETTGIATCVVNDVPAIGSSAVYTIYIDNGITEYIAGTYTVSKAPYGIQVFNSIGNRVLELSNRVARFVQTGSGQSLPASGTATISVTGMQNNDSWDVIVMSETSGFITFSITKSTGSFTVTNNSGIATTFSYWVLRT